jgi:deoxycytidine triphosphate deaminase
MLTDLGVRAAIADDFMEISPLVEDSLQPASYDFTVGAQAFVSGSNEIIDVTNRGLVIIDPGEYAVLATQERIRCGPQIAGQLGLCSPLARQGLILLSGPQVDPGFDGVLVVRVTNLAPRRITLPYRAPFLTAQFFKLAHPVAHPYDGSRQGQTGLGPRDFEELSQPDSPTLGGMVKSLSTLASDVSDLKTSVRWMAWAIPIIVGIGMTIIGIIVGLH